MDPRNTKNKVLKDWLLFIISTWVHEIHLLFIFLWKSRMELSLEKRNTALEAVFWKNNYFLLLELRLLTVHITAQLKNFSLWLFASLFVISKTNEFNIVIFLQSETQFQSFVLKQPIAFWHFSDRYDSAWNFLLNFTS